MSNREDTRQASPTRQASQAAGTNEKQLRIFVAIELPMAVKAAVGAAQTGLQEYLGESQKAVRWVRSEGIHLTLQFLGDTPESKIPAVEDAVRKSAVGIQPFSLTLGELGAFPNARRPRVIWLGLKAPEEELQHLTNLQSAVSRELDAMGYKGETNFHPHLTLGRIREDAPSEYLADVTNAIEMFTAEGVLSASFRVTGVSVVQSTMGPGGSAYTQLAAIPLEQ